MSSPQWLIDGIVDDLPAEDRGLIDTTLETMLDCDLTEIGDVLVSRVLRPLEDGPAGETRGRALVDADLRLHRHVVDLLSDLIELALMEGWTVEMRTSRARQLIGQAGF